MELLETDAPLCPLAPYEVPGKVHEHHTGASPVGRVRLVPLRVTSLALGCRGGRDQRLQTGAGLSHLFLSSLTLSSAEEQLKAQSGCAHWEGMETCRLSFTEIILRGPRLADRVWVPVVPGWAARVIMSGEWPAFLPTASWAPSRHASPNT